MAEVTTVERVREFLKPWEGRCLVCGCSTDEPQAVRAALKGSP